MRIEIYFSEQQVKEKDEIGIAKPTGAPGLAVYRVAFRQRELWPEHDGKTIRIARRLVGALAQDPRLCEELALACSRGAAAWWLRRPLRYRG